MSAADDDRPEQPADDGDPERDDPVGIAEERAAEEVIPEDVDPRAETRDIIEVTIVQVRPVDVDDRVIPFGAVGNADADEKDKGDAESKALAFCPLLQGRGGDCVCRCHIEAFIIIISVPSAGRLCELLPADIFY